MLTGQVQIDDGVADVGMAEQFLEARQIGAGFEQVRGVAVAQRMRVNVLVMPARCAATRQACQTTLSETGASTRCPSTTPGNTYVTGLIQRQYSRKASSSLGLSGTSRSRLPLPSRICTSIRSLSMSAALSCTTSPRRMPVETGSSGSCDTTGWVPHRSSGLLPPGSEPSAGGEGSSGTGCAPAYSGA